MRNVIRVSQRVNHGRTCVTALPAFQPLHFQPLKSLSCCVARERPPAQLHLLFPFFFLKKKYKVVIPVLCFTACIAFQAWEFVGSHDDPARARSLFKSVRAGWVKVCRYLTQVFDAMPCLPTMDEKTSSIAPLDTIRIARPGFLIWCTGSYCICLCKV